jgi:hypothetical protein
MKFATWHIDRITVLAAGTSPVSRYSRKAIIIAEEKGMSICK